MPLACRASPHIVPCLNRKAGHPTAVVAMLTAVVAMLAAVVAMLAAVVAMLAAVVAMLAAVVTIRETNHVGGFRLHPLYILAVSFLVCSIASERGCV